MGLELQAPEPWQGLLGRDQAQEDWDWLPHQNQYSKPKGYFEPVGLKLVNFRSTVMEVIKHKNQLTWRTVFLLLPWGWVLSINHHTVVKMTCRSWGDCLDNSPLSKSHAKPVPRDRELHPLCSYEGTMMCHLCSMPGDPPKVKLCTHLVKDQLVYLAGQAIWSLWLLSSPASLTQS